MTVKYKSVLIGVRGYKHRETMHDSLLAAKRYLLNNLRADGSRPGWIFRVEQGAEKRLPPQYEVRSMAYWPWNQKGKVGLFARNRRTGTLGTSPLLTLSTK